MSQYWTVYDPNNSGAFIHMVRALHGAATQREPGIDPGEHASELHRTTNAVLDAANLSEDERVIICQRYGLNAEDKVYQLEELSEISGKGRIEIRRIELCAVRKLADPPVRNALGLECRL